MQIAQTIQIWSQSCFLNTNPEYYMRLKAVTHKLRYPHIWCAIWQRQSNLICAHSTLMNDITFLLLILKQLRPTKYINSFICSVDLPADVTFYTCFMFSLVLAWNLQERQKKGYNEHSKCTRTHTESKIGIY